MELASELEVSLREFSLQGPVEVCENGSRLAPLSSLSWEVRGAQEKPLLHLWSQQYNLTRRVLAIIDYSEEHLTLAVERFGHTKPGRLEFVRTSVERTALALAREKYCVWLSRILAQEFPDDPVQSLVISPDLENSLSGNYARGLLRRGSTSVAVIGVPEGNTPEDVAKSLTFALLWLDRASHLARRGGVSSLRLIVPKGTTLPVSHRLAVLDSPTAVELFECDSTQEKLERVDWKSLGNLSTLLVPHRETQDLIGRARPALNAIIAWDPQAITIHPVCPTREVFLRFHGLPFVHWKDGQVFFGISESRRELTVNSEPALKALWQELETRRHPLTTDTRHPLYRAQPERWLESLVREDITRVDAALDPRFVYSQVFADAGGQHAILDLVGVTRTGRLAVIELKASEHIHLPLQAADYWLRVRRHLRQGDFTRHGYFPGVQLQQLAPIVYLVAPALHFHPATDILLRYLSRDLEVVRVGLAEGWRRGVRVVMRQ